MIWVNILIPKASEMEVLIHFCRNISVPAPAGLKLAGVCPWAFCQIWKMEGCACAGRPRTFCPQPGVSDPDMHHGTGIANQRFPMKSVAGKTFPAFPAHTQHVILLILNIYGSVYRVSSGQGKVREIPDLAKVREKSGNFVEGQGKNEYWEKSGKSQGICI